MARKGKPVGWRNEPVRHGLAAKGIKTETPAISAKVSREYAERAVKIIKDYGGIATIGTTYGEPAAHVHKQPRELGEWVELTDKGGRIWLSTTGSRISPEDAKDYIKELQLALTIIDTIEYRLRF